MAEDLFDRALELVMDGGQTLLANGGEVFRVQQTMEIMAASLGVQDFHVYVLTNGIFASAQNGTVSAVRHVPVVSTNLGHVEAILGLTVSGWASMTSIICFVSGVQLICLGVIGEYIGKIYMETKHRPRYIISETTPNFGETKEDNA